jgi:hypothetical protein
VKTFTAEIKHGDCLNVLAGWFANNHSTPQTIKGAP